MNQDIFRFIPDTLGEGISFKFLMGTLKKEWGLILLDAWPGELSPMIGVTYTSRTNITQSQELYLYSSLLLFI